MDPSGTARSNFDHARFVCLCVCARTQARARAPNKHGCVKQTLQRNSSFLCPVFRMFEAEDFVRMSVSMKTVWFWVETFKGSSETLIYLRPNTWLLICVCGDFKKLFRKG